MPLRTLDQINPTDSLLIFKYFRVDRTLPKYAEEEARKQQRKNQKQGVSKGSLVWNGDEDGPDMMIGRSSMTIRGGTSKAKAKPAKGRLARLWSWISRESKDEPEDEPVTEVFARIKASADELVEWDERNAALTEMIERARTAGQAELLKRLEVQKTVRQFENALYVKDRRKLVTEEQLLAFTAKCEKGLCLDWVRDFMRPIPPEVVTEKAACDADHLFDNYAVLHFDPKNRATSPEARERARDPILFGLIQGSRRLYFIGDWVDELCDLTFQQIITSLDNPLEMSDSPT